MTVRPKLDEETVERLNKRVDKLVRVDAETVAIDDKVNIVLDELGAAGQEAPFAGDSGVDPNGGGLR